MKLRLAALLGLLALAPGCRRVADRLQRAAAEPGDAAAWARFVADPGTHARYDRFRAYLARRGVAEVAPPWQLWRQGSDWRAEGLPPFAIPPEEEWRHIVPTLRLVRDRVVPRTGELEVVSGFRTPSYNRRCGGSRGSRHLHFEALDLEPTTDIERGDLHARLGEVWSRSGRRRRMGLGLYSGRRFHVDAHRHRRW